MEPVAVQSALPPRDGACTVRIMVHRVSLCTKLILGWKHIVYVLQDMPSDAVQKLLAGCVLRLVAVGGCH